MAKNHLDDTDDTDDAECGHYFGHPIYLENKKDDGGIYSYWRYNDTNELIKESPDRECNHCGKYQTEEGHDPCIANLPGVEQACCGHGKSGGYLVFGGWRDGTALRFDCLTNVKDK